MARQEFRAMGMDTLERLYYERQNSRRKAYNAKQKKSAPKTKITAQRHCMKEDSAALDRMLRENLYYDMESVCYNKKPYALSNSIC